MARRQADSSLSEAKTQLNEAKRREQQIIAEGRELVTQRDRRFRETEVLLNRERESAKAVVAQTLQYTYTPQIRL